MFTLFSKITCHGEGIFLEVEHLIPIHGATGLEAIAAKLKAGMAHSN